MKYFNWNEEKNIELQQGRGISFEEITFAIGNGGLLDEIKHHDQTKYPNQRIFIVEYNGYAYLVPYVSDDERYFLKTIYPSRKAAKKYLNIVVED